MLGALIEQKTPSWIHYCLNSHLQDAISPQILDSQENIENEGRPKIHCTWNLVVGRRGAANYDTVLNLGYIAVSKLEGRTTARLCTQTPVLCYKDKNLHGNVFHELNELFIRNPTPLLFYGGKNIHKILFMN